ncbi:hypothetical protein [Cupriavidus sp. D39]|uniref:hypothetical protein n=1 Tax=Cupriavidus sp. D39 TaxID=2997877 RepID=UPI002D1E3EF0|nr:hypothetical protein [Cupriavidus sp. D39]
MRKKEGAGVVHPTQVTREIVLAAGGKLLGALLWFAFVTGKPRKRAFADLECHAADFTGRHFHIFCTVQDNSLPSGHGNAH